MALTICERAGLSGVKGSCSVEFGTPDRVEWHLLNWAKWMRHGGGPDGYPHQTLGTINWTIRSDFDNMCESQDRRCANIVDEIIAGLSPVERAAIHKQYGIAVFRFPRDNFNQALVNAKAKIGVELNKRGVW